MRQFIPVLLGLFLLGACATATPYQQASENQRGFAQQQLENDRWQVSFSGNSLTDRKTVETYLLYRAAEITSNQGFDYFRVVQRNTDTNTTFMPVGFSHSPFYTGFHCNYAFYGRRGRLRSPYYRSAFFYDPFYDPFGPNSVREIIRYEANAEIIMGRGDKPAGDSSYFNADEVLMNLAGSIQRPEA